MATNLGSGILVSPQDLYSYSTVQQTDLGARALSSDGRSFRYALAGAVALSPGDALQSPAVVANHVNLTPTALPSAGDTTITVTLGATAATANQYSNGTLTVEKGTLGVGQTFLIKSHPAAISGGTLVITLSDPVVTTITGTVTVSLIANPYNGVIQSPSTTLTGTIVGVAVGPIPANQYGWICVGGVTGLKVSGTPIVGSSVGVPTTTAGMAVADSAILAHVGSVAKAAITTQITPVKLALD